MYSRLKQILSVFTVETKGALDEGLNALGTSRILRHGQGPIGDFLLAANDWLWAKSPFASVSVLFGSLGCYCWGSSDHSYPTIKVSAQ